MSRPSIDRLQAAADTYYAEGCRLVDVADTYWANANDQSRPEDMRAASRHAYELVSKRAQTQFRRHDAALDVIARRQAAQADEPAA